ncbi:hypothetical protein NCC49_005919 [Naganishia albida]|nr:hypothetical protein NCC49_005919 [Naganishia albida]
MLADKTSQPVGRRGRRSAVGNGMRPLRLRGGGSDANSGARAPNQNGSRSASASVSTTSEHDAVGQTRESTTSSSSFDLQQYQAYTANGSLEPQPVPLVTTTRNSSSSHLTGSSNTSDHDLSAQGWSSGIHAGPAFVVNHPYQPVPLVAQHLAVSTTYSSASPATSVSYPQQLESHSRGHQPPPRAYSVSDSVTSSGTSYNGYGQPSGDGRARGPADNGGGSGAKGKGRSLEEDESAVLSGVALEDGEAVGENMSRLRRHRRTTSSVSRKTDDSASYPTEFTAQLLTGLSKPPAPQKTTTLTTSGKKQNLPPSAYPHLRPGDTVTDPNTPHIHGCPYCNKVYRGQHARSICRRHQMSKHGIELEVQVKKSRWDNNPNRPATEEEKHQRTLESKRRWAAKDRKRRRCLKLGIPYISSSDEDASGSEDDGSMYNVVAGLSSDYLGVETSARSARSRSRSGSASKTPEVSAEASGQSTKAGGKSVRRGSSALQQVAFPEDEDEVPVTTSRRGGRKRADAGKQAAESSAMARNGSRSRSSAGFTLKQPFTSEPMDTVVAVKTEEGTSSSKRKSGGSRRTTERTQGDNAKQGSALARHAPTGAAATNGEIGHRPVAMVPTQSQPSQPMIYQQPIGEPPVFMNIPEGARVYAVQYRDDPRTGYRVVSAPQPVFYIPTSEQGSVPLRPSSAPPDDSIARNAPALLDHPPSMLSPIIVDAEVHGVLAPPVTLRPDPLRRAPSHNQYPAPIPSGDGDVFSVQPAGAQHDGPSDHSEPELRKAAIRRSSDHGPEKQKGKKAASQDSDSNEEAAEILLAFSNSPARSVTASTRKHTRHHSMDTGLAGKLGDTPSTSAELSVLAGSSRLQDITTGLQTDAASPGTVDMEGEEDTTPVAPRPRAAKPPPVRPASEETPFQRSNLWPARHTSAPKEVTEDDPFRVPEIVKADEADGNRTPGELAPSAYIMAPPPRPVRAATNVFRQPKDIIPSSSTNPSLSSPPGPEPSAKAVGPTPKPTASRSGLTPFVGGSRIAFATPARQDWVASSPALGHPFSSPSGLDLTHKLGLAADVSTVPDSPSWLELVRATPDAKAKRNRTESLDEEIGAEVGEDTPGKRLRL